MMTTVLYFFLAVVLISCSLATAAILDSSDFEYQGVFTLPGDSANVMWGFTTGALAGRRVGGQIHLFITGKGIYQARTPPHQPHEVYEINYPGVGADVNTAPRAALVRAWGDIYQDRLITRNNAGGVVRGLLWHADKLWWAYGDYYNTAGYHDPSIGCTILNDSAGTFKSFGPWRTEAHSQMTRGYMMEIPQWFADQYVNGHTLGTGGSIAAGNANSPWGAVTFASPVVDTGTPADDTTNTHISIACSTLIQHTLSHKQYRSPDYVSCGWDVIAGYDCANGSWERPADTVFAGLDMISAATWIDLPDKQGVVYFGQLITPAHAGDPLPHYWYGPETCCHGFSDPFFSGKGDAASSRVPHWFIYDPADFVKVLEGTSQPWGLTPAHLVRMSGVNVFWENVATAHHGGVYFDSTSRLLFISSIAEDRITNSYEPRPLVHVWHIKNGPVHSEKTVKKDPDAAISVSPNPFNPRTKITITNLKLSASPANRGERITNYELEIFNIQGKIVMQFTPDIHNSFSWDASACPSGIYIVNFRMGKQVLAKAITLMK